jgi:hypothetical protein
MDIATKDENSYQLLPRTYGVREPDRALSFQPDLKVYNYHPLIHTIASETSAQDVEQKKAEQRTPHFFSSNQDIVAWS